jgi:hypothetical protein
MKADWKRFLPILIACLVVGGFILAFRFGEGSAIFPLSEGSSNLPAVQRATKYDFELSNGSCKRSSSKLLFTGIVTNVGKHDAPEVRVLGVVTSIASPGSGFFQYTGNYRGVLGTFRNLRTGGARQFTYSVPNQVMVSDIPVFDRTQLKSYNQGLTVLTLQTPTIEFEIN